MTVNNPKFNFQIKNYKELLNVKITFDGKLLQLINHNDGSYTLLALSKGVSYLVIHADNSINDTKIKCINGAFTKNDILGSTNDVIVTTNGVYKMYDNLHDEPALKKIYFNLPNPLKKEDIIATSDNLLVTKYGIFDTNSNKQILTSMYSTFSKEQLVAISSDFLITKNGIFRYNGDQIAAQTFPTVEKEDIILVSGNILVTKNGIFDAPNEKQILKEEFSHPNASEILGIANNSYAPAKWAISYLITTKGLFDHTGYKFWSFSEHLPTLATDLIAYSCNFIVTTYGVYNIQNKNWLFKNRNIQKNLIAITDTSLITTFGIYKLSGNKDTILYPISVNRSDILQTTPYSVITKKGIIFTNSDNMTYPINLTSDDLITKNSRGYWEGQTCITTKCVVTNYRDIMRGILLPNDDVGNPIQLCNNEIIYFDGYKTALTPYSALTLSSIVDSSGQLLMNTKDIPNIRYNFPNMEWPIEWPKGPTTKTKDYTGIIAGSVSAIIILLIIFGITWGIIAHKRNKAVNKRLDRLTTAIGSVFQKFIQNSKNNNKPLLIGEGKKYNNPSSSKPTNKTFIPINNKKPPIKPIN